MSFDRILTGLTIIDGLGAAPFQTDIGIKAGRISALGDLSSRDAKVRESFVDRIATPGFIDIHTHYDFCLGWSGLADHCYRQGVTTVVGGNCGLGPAKLKDHFAWAETQMLGLRYGVLASHGPLRSRLIPRAEGRAARPEERHALQQLVHQALDDGALGVSFGPYHENSLADERELQASVRAAAACQKPFVVHRRCEGQNVLEATREVIRLAKEAKAPLHISHLKVAGKANWSQYEQMRKELEQAKNAISVGFDVYPYDGSLTYLSAVLPSSFKADGRLAERLEDSAQRQAMRVAIRDWFEQRQGPEQILVFAKHMPQLSGLRGPNLAAAAAALNLDDEAEAALAIIAADPQATGGWAAYLSMMSSQHVDELCRDSQSIIASDAVPETDGMSQDTHPRAYGTFAKCLAAALRQSPEELARIMPRLTSRPAERYRLKELGRLAQGAVADIVILDPEQLEDLASYEEPARYPKGIESVYLGGERVWHEGQRDRRVRGQVLRR